MGNYIVHKALLLDEADLALPPTAVLGDLAQAVLAQFEAKYACELGLTDDVYDDNPTFEPYGVAFERLDASGILDHEYAHRLEWLGNPGTFRMAFQRAFNGFDVTDEEVDHLLTGTHDGFEECLKRKVCDAVSAGRYNQAESLMRGFTGIRATGLPGVCHQSGFDRFDNEQDITDFRSANHGPGTRILMEVGFNFGQ